MYRYTHSEMTRSGSTGWRHGTLAAALAAGIFVLALAPALLPGLAVASPGSSVADLRSQAAAVRREVARLDKRAEVATEQYNVARAALDAFNIRLEEARRTLERTQAQLDAAQAMRGQRLADMYKSDDLGLIDVLFSLSDLSDVGTQFGYFRSIDAADQQTVDGIAAMEQAVQALTRQIDSDRAQALSKEMDLREKQATIEDELAARQSLLDDLDARVKELIARQTRLDAAAARRLAREAGVDLRTIRGSAAQIAVVKETMKYLGIPYVWAGATPSGGFDCSGLVLYVYARFGVDFPHGATMQAHMGVPVPLSQAQPADLVFFGYPAFYHHVGIYIGNGLFIEAPHTGDVVKVSRLAGRGCSLICRYPIRLP
jgi:cell wall-associated NlpC family hydrolase